MRVLSLVFVAVLAPVGAIAQTSVPVVSPAPALADAPVRTTDCLDLQRIERTEVIDNKTIIFHMNGKAKWKNEMPFNCPQLKWEDRFLFRSSINKICSVDTITVLSSIGGGFQPGASCGLGKFTALDDAGYKAIKDAQKALRAARKTKVTSTPQR